LLVHAKDGNVEIVGPGINVQHVLHVSHKFCVRRGWYHPVLNIQ